MSSSGGCPSVETVVSYAAGRLTTGGLDALDAHLDACNACNQLVIETLNDRGTALAPERSRPRIFRPAQLIAGRYEIVAFLGAGGMGEVYEARDRELGDLIALKTVSAAVPLDPRAVARLKAEAQLARRVTHRNVCRIFDVGVHTDRTDGTGSGFTTPFLTMELIRGRALSDRIRAGERFQTSQVLEIVRQITRGLEAAHEAGVLHRDLKSDNVLLSTSSDEKLRAVITDFGLAAAIAVVDEEGVTASASSYLGGTRPYLAPERLTGARATVASDIYSLGMVLREVTTGALASASNGHAHEALSHSLPLEPVVRRCLLRDPTRRFATVSEVLHAVERHAPSIASAVDVADGATPGRRRRFTHRIGPGTAWAIVGALTLALASVISPIVLGARRRPSPPTSGAVSAAVAVTPSPPITAAHVEAIAPAPGESPTRLRSRRSPEEKKNAAVAPSSRQLLITADQRLRAGRIDEACAAGRDAAAVAPTSADVWEFLGRCYMRLGEPARARACYQKYLTIAPEGPDATFVRAILDEKQP